MRWIDAQPKVTEQRLRGARVEPHAAARKPPRDRSLTA
jgi:hypothetical protein